MLKTNLLLIVTVSLFSTASELTALELISDGKPVSTIVVPDKATDLEQEAAKKLADYLKRASGAELPIVAESQKSSGNLISVGKTRLAMTAGITGEGLKYDGYRLVVKGETLYLLGRDTSFIQENTRVGAQGSIRAVLGLLDHLGFRWLQPTPMGTYVPPLKTVSVPDNLDIIHQPVFMFVAGRLYTCGDWSLANDYRKAAKLFSSGGHTWCIAVPSTLYKDHPEYFRMQGGKRIQPDSVDNFQLCPSNPDVIRLVAEWTIQKFDEGYDIVALGQPDGYQACECERCAKFSDADQVHNAERKIIEMVGKKYPDHLVHLLVYGPTLAPPSAFTSYPPNTMTEVALTGSLGLEFGTHEKGVRRRRCRRGCSLGLEFGTHEKGLDFWRTLVPGGTTAYSYYMGLYHGIGLAPRYTPLAAARDIQMLQSHGVKGIYFCGAGENWGIEGPVCYVIGRISNDPTRKWSVVLDEYCNLTFRKAGRTMRQFYDLWYSRLESLPSRKIGESLPATYPPDTLEQMANLLALAKTQAAGDERALNWIRVSEVSYTHVALLAKAYCLYGAYQINPTMNNLEQVRDAVAAYHAFADELLALPSKDAGFIQNYLVNAGYWTGPVREYNGFSVRENLGELHSPFTWDFPTLIKTRFLPGKTRSKAAFTHLKTPPSIDGDVSKDAWAAVPWIEMPPSSLGKAEASTRVRLGYDAKNLYFAFECNEPRMDEMKVIEYGRDGRAYNTECVEIFLAPDGAGQKRVQLVISPTKSGIWDARYGYIDDPLDPRALSGEGDTSWNPAYEHAFKMDKAGKKWTVEVAIPFAALESTVPPEGTRWRANLGRERHMAVWDNEKYHGQREFFLWSPNLQGADFTEPAAFGDVYFGFIPERKETAANIH
jgi:hypothetical protein